jgi:hypothetical protein
MDMWLYNKSTKLLYKVLRVEGDTIWLKSEETQIEFDAPLNIEGFKQQGYDLYTEAQAREAGLLTDD